jgi:hypothetical protein
VNSNTNRRFRSRSRRVKESQSERLRFSESFLVENSQSTNRAPMKTIARAVFSRFSLELVYRGARGRAEFGRTASAQRGDESVRDRPAYLRRAVDQFKRRTLQPAFFTVSRRVFEYARILRHIVFPRARVSNASAARGKSSFAFGHFSVFSETCRLRKRRKRDSLSKNKLPSYRFWA